MDFEFTLFEMLEMENLFKESREEALAPQFCEKLASSFSYAPSRAGKEAITPRQVQSWFQDRLKKSQPQVASSNMALKLLTNLSDASTSFGATESSQKLKGNASDLSELIFEALSSKDNAWYDVASFLNYRVLCSGELEVRVRFAGFRNTDDEWVSVRRAVRERSIPLEPSECQRVKVGDLVLCFQEREERAVYCDAHVLEINRQLHDINSCRCTFVVRYDHDDIEENVQLDRLCRRPPP
ncbi:PROTEIN SAWADEE HOMEODOMAIN-like protein 1 [Salix viminalis]|uniref:PROTEIN SAWADEE HOMEODOMAIN-like protein 1 n=1 Tax=Salix viminalis TaxID=40686 RepID=A0A9Q0YYZ3_SALVM|nr:PROTEIN SAWADEE HOMEODOMAIN-like protein 1 [Salix viminalis]